MAPQLDAADRQVLSVALEAGKMADGACRALEAYKHFENARAAMTALVKARSWATP